MEFFNLSDNINIKYNSSYYIGITKILFSCWYSSAMPEEVGIILDNLDPVQKFGDLELYSGEFTLDNSEEILITTGWSGWGKKC